MSSEFTCPVVKIGSIEKHSNADTLSITEVEGCPCIFRTGDFQPGEQAVYIPVEALIPEGREWVKEHCSHLTFKNGVHFREGVVVRPASERAAHCGRVSLKIVGQTYLLRKEGSEKH